MKQKLKRPTEIFVIDQRWPLNIGPLPIDFDLEKKMNKKSGSDNPVPKLYEFLKDNDYSPKNFISDQLQFFNRFKHLVHINDDRLKVLTLDNFTQWAGPYNGIFKGYRCLMLLSIDDKGQVCYLLGK